MILKRLFHALGIALVLVTAAAAQGVSEIEALWREGRFDEARVLIGAHGQAAATDLAYLQQAARAQEEMRDYAPAADLYAQAAKLLGARPEDYRQAREHEWRCRWLAGGSAASAAWLTAARSEIESRLGGQKGKKSSEYRLALELQAQLALISGQASRPGDELRQRFPDSVLVLRAAKAAADALAAERDDQQRLKLCNAFLKDYPGCYWRHVAYRYLLYTAWRLHDAQALKHNAALYLAEYPNDPNSHGAVSRYYFDADIEAQAGLAAAKRSVELYETALGSDGSAASLADLNEKTRGLPPRPDYELPSRRSLFVDYLGSRYNLARYLLAAKQWDAALNQVQPVVDLAPFTLDEELTLAPFCLAATQARAALGDDVLAYYDAYQVLVEGDATNRYGLQAEGLRNELAGKQPNQSAGGNRIDMMPPELAYLPDVLRDRMAPLPQFTDVTKAAGLEGRECTRVAWGDVDGEGDADLLLDGSTLLLNQGARGFADVTKQWGLSGKANGGTFGDYDNDGDLDLYAYGAGQHGDRLWRNEGGHFADVTAVTGGAWDDEDSQAAAWLDYDADGWLDLYVVNAAARSEWSGGSQRAGTPNRLYRNNGAGSFTAIALESVGLAPPFGEPQDGRGLSIADVDSNGLPDIFSGNYRLQENALYLNSGGAFSNLARRLGVAGFNVDGCYGNTLGSDFGDIDVDGDLDLFSANLASARMQYSCNKSQLLVADPDTSGPPNVWMTPEVDPLDAPGTLAGHAPEHYYDQRSARGIKYEETHCDLLFGDFNNDGALDLFITSAYENRRSFLYLNDGKGHFGDVTYIAGARVLGGWGCAAADYDRDGDLDLAVAAPGGLKLLRNDSPTQRWLEVRCTGGQGAGVPAAAGDPGWSNTAAIGARVTLSLGAIPLIRELQSCKGIGCGNELVAHFGLGNFTGRVGVIVRFPSGRVVTKAVMQPDQLVEISEITMMDKQPAKPPEPKPERAPGWGQTPVERPAETKRGR